MVSITRSPQRLALSARGRGGLLVLTLFWLAAMVFAAPRADAAHPSLALLEVTEDPGSSSAEGLPTAPPPATPATAALLCLAVLALPFVLAAPRARRTVSVAAAA